MLCLSLAGSLLFAGLAVYEYIPIYKNDRLIEDLRRRSVGDPGKDPLQRTVDFEGLQRVNPDIIGWLYIPETTIDLPVLKGKTDTEYLWKGYDGEYSPVGSLFTYADEPEDLSAANPYIFGHTLPIFDMFGELRMYTEDEEYRKSKNMAYIYTPEKSFEIQLYSIFTCRQDDELFTHDMDLNSGEYAQMILEYAKRNKYGDIKAPAGIREQSSVQTFSLSSCYGGPGTPYRLVIHWLEVRAEYKIDSTLPV